jgi:sensor histidine kinase regulating citrate/malate metabolism
MRRYNDLSVKVKIPLIICILVFIVFVVVCLLLLNPLRSGSFEDMQKMRDEIENKII